MDVVDTAKDEAITAEGEVIEAAVEDGAKAEVEAAAEVLEGSW